MGCDVHMFVERKNSETNSWEKVNDEFFYDYSLKIAEDYIIHNLGLTREESNHMIKKFFKGDKPNTKLEEYVIDKFLIDVFSDNSEEVYKLGKLSDPRTDQPYNGRNYTLFGVLAGVRDNYMHMISDGLRGLPIDVSKEIYDLSDECDIDGHSHNYLYLDEIIDSEYYGMSDDRLDDIGLGTHFFRTTVNSLLELGDTKDIRIVFWFDN